MKVALYVRVSSDAQDVGLSIGAQLQALREYANRQGHTIVREFIDEAESGRTSQRPAFLEMIALAKTKEPPFEGILVWKLNRFARNRLDSITHKELLRKKGISVVSMNEPLENNPSGKLLEGIIESMDEFYSANMGQDIKRGIRESARRGFFVGCRPPYGFHKVGVRDGNKTRNRLEPDSVDLISWKTANRIFTMALNDNGTKEIAMALNRDGLRTSTGSKWTKTYIYKILTNETYCGTLALGVRPRHGAINSSEPPVRVENAWPGIIARKTFDIVQGKMAARRPTAVHPRVLPSFYLLSGLLRCSCGQAMTGRSAKSHQFYYYTCSRSNKQGRDACTARNLPKKKLENFIVDHIKEKILDTEVIEKLVALANEDIDAGNVAYKGKLDTIDGELKEVNCRLTKLYDALETGKLELNDLAPRIKELKVRQDDLLKTRVLLEADMTLHGVQHLNGRRQLLLPVSDNYICRFPSFLFWSFLLSGLRCWAAAVR